MNCYIFGAGSYFGLPLRPGAEDLVLAADGGLRYLTAEGLEPHALIGDFDSGSVPEQIACPVSRYPVEKDETDMQLAISHGLMRGARDFFLLGGTGGRVDHTLANLACLAHLTHLGRRGYLFGDGYVSLMLKNDTLRLPQDLPIPLSEGTASIFAFGADAKGVTIRGLQYEADDVTLFSHIPTGVSNHYSPSTPAQITVREGMLLLLLPIQKGTDHECS